VEYRFSEKLRKGVTFVSAGFAVKMATLSVKEAGQTRDYLSGARSGDKFAIMGYIFQENLQT